MKFTMALAVLLSIANVANADLVTLVSVPSYPTGAHANALAGPLFSSAYHPVDIPGAGSGFAFASKLGNSATHDFSVKLDYTMTPAFFDSSYFGPFFRTSVLGHRADAESIFHFSVDVPTKFDVSGVFSVSDSIGTTIPGNVELEIELLEFVSLAPMSPPPVVKFYSYQTSKSTIGESFVVGGMGGDTINSMIGTPLGFLDPGKFYRYRTLVTLNAIDVDGIGPILPTNGGASASGTHVIKFTAAVPEPSSFLVLTFVVGCLISQRTRRLK